MAQYLGLVKLGGFYNNGTILKRPTKPWRPDSEPYSGCGVGDIPQMSGSMANYTLGSTPAADANKLQLAQDQGRQQDPPDLRPGHPGLSLLERSERPGLHHRQDRHHRRGDL